MTPTPTRPEPTMPTREELLRLCNEVLSCHAHEYAAHTVALTLKQHLTSEPAGPISVVPAEVFAMCADILNGYDSPTIRETALATVLHGLFTKPREPEPVASVPVTPEVFREELAQVLHKMFASGFGWLYLSPEGKDHWRRKADALIAEPLLAASTGARGAVVEEIAK